MGYLFSSNVVHQEYPLTVIFDSECSRRRDENARHFRILAHVAEPANIDGEVSLSMLLNSTPSELYAVIVGLIMVIKKSSPPGNPLNRDHRNGILNVVVSH